jgi:hypothetical protein
MNTATVWTRCFWFRMFHEQGVFIYQMGNCTFPQGLCSTQRVNVGVYWRKAQIFSSLRHDLSHSVRSLDKQKDVTLWILCLKLAAFNINRFKHLLYKQDYEIRWNISWNDCTFIEDRNLPTVKIYVFCMPQCPWWSFVAHTNLLLPTQHFCWTDNCITNEIPNRQRYKLLYFLYR